MAPEFVKVSRIDEWPPAGATGRTVWIIRGTTLDDVPQFVTLKTTDKWKADICEICVKRDRYLVATWKREGRVGAMWLQKVSLDTSAFEHEAV